ncbi:FLJ37770-like protein [Acromyrmex echinatior]|uniref:FLJ37770-like protein n=1 Tax=Acromyrmex echinatior TaxID=103372 RepID=F4WPK0_ACREC|nr:FLJ37770-like protein [Acromyrmex echinatior]EGI63874.1 FLJ37770-like protein [Acromyrmex echinatior]
MNEKIEQRICLKFCIANGISYAESLKMLQKAYGESILSKTRAYEWYSALKSGRDVVKNHVKVDQKSK